MLGRAAPARGPEELPWTFACIWPLDHLQHPPPCEGPKSVVRLSKLTLSVTCCVKPRSSAPKLLMASVHLLFVLVMVHNVQIKLLLRAPAPAFRLRMEGRATPANGPRAQ